MPIAPSQKPFATPQTPFAERRRRLDAQEALDVAGMTARGREAPVWQEDIHPDLEDGQREPVEEPVQEDEQEPQPPHEKCSGSGRGARHGLIERVSCGAGML